MEKKKVYYLETQEEGRIYFEKFYQIANYLKRDANELWSSYMEGEEPEIHSETKYTNFTISQDENFTGNRRKYFENLCEEAQLSYYDSSWSYGDEYLKERPSEGFMSHLVTKAFGLKNRIEYIDEYMFIVLPKKLCSVVIHLSDWERDSEDIGYYYMKHCFDNIIKSIKNSQKYPYIQSKVYYSFEPWEYIDRNGYVVKTHWSSHYSSTLEMDRLK